MSARVFYAPVDRAHYVRLELTPDQAEAVADGLGQVDVAYAEIMAAVHQARCLDEEDEANGRVAEG